MRKHYIVLEVDDEQEQAQLLLSLSTAIMPGLNHTLGDREDHIYAVDMISEYPERVIALVKDLP